MRQIHDSRLGRNRIHHAFANRHRIVRRAKISHENDGRSRALGACILRAEQETDENQEGKPTKVMTRERHVSATRGCPPLLTPRFRQEVSSLPQSWRHASRYVTFARACPPRL